MDPSLARVWNQRRIPVVVRGGIFPLIVRLPYSPDNREWLRGSNRSIPEWLTKYKAWSIPKAWFDEVIRQLLDKFGAAYVIQPFRTTEKCAPACWNATGAQCECSCMGANHGSGSPTGKWHIVSETFAVQIKSKDFSCRLLRPQQQGLAGALPN